MIVQSKTACFVRLGLRSPRLDLWFVSRIPLHSKQAQIESPLELNLKFCDKNQLSCGCHRGIRLPEHKFELCIFAARCL